LKAAIKINNLNHRLSNNKQISTIATVRKSKRIDTIIKNNTRSRQDMSSTLLYTVAPQDNRTTAAQDTDRGPVALLTYCYDDFSSLNTPVTPRLLYSSSPYFRFHRPQYNIKRPTTRRHLVFDAAFFTSAMHADDRCRVRCAMIASADATWNAVTTGILHENHDSLGFKIYENDSSSRN
jgi:hypothetical protein